MFGLRAYEIDGIREEAGRQFENWPENYKSILWNAIQAVFEMWKLEFGDRSPKTGLLLFIPIDFKEAKPFQCAGMGVSNNIDLAFKLWTENYGPFMSIVDKVTVPKIFAMILLEDAREGTDLRSVARARDLLHSFQKDALDVTLEVLAPLAEAGIRFKTVQSKRAKKPRGKVSEEGETISEIIRRLALSREHEEESAKSLWPLFFAELENQGLAPEEEEAEGDLRKNRYWYDFNASRKSITYGQFANQVSKHRTGKNQDSRATRNP